MPLYTYYLPANMLTLIFLLYAKSLTLKLNLSIVYLAIVQTIGYVVNLIYNEINRRQNKFDPHPWRTTLPIIVALSAIVIWVLTIEYFLHWPDKTWIEEFAGSFLNIILRTMDRKKGMRIHRKFLRWVHRFWKLKHKFQYPKKKRVNGRPVSTNFDPTDGWIIILFIFSQLFK